MKIKKLDHVSISTVNLEATKKFYCELLGLKVGFRPNLESSGYWLYSDKAAIIHLVETEEKLDKQTSLSQGKEVTSNLIETGRDDHIALTVEDSADLVNIMKDNDVDYWDRLLVDRNLYQIFIQDPNGVIIELNDYKPEADKINPITIIK